MEEIMNKIDYDPLFLNILQREGSIDSFIQVFFGFLQRNTDFFRIMPDPSAKFGFPPGAARQKVFNAFKSFEDRSWELFPDEKRLVEEAIRAAKSSKKAVASASASDAASAAAPAAKPAEKVETFKPLSTTYSATTSPASKIKASKATSSPDEEDAARTDEGKEVPQSNADATSKLEEAPIKRGVEGRPSKFQDNPDSYNGAVREKYSWSQDIQELDVRVFVGDHIKKGKQVAVDLRDDSLRVEATTTTGEWETLTDGRFKWKVHPTNSMWTLVPGDHVLVSLEKIQERWWDACFEGEEDIDLKAIDCSRPLEDLDQESLATVNKLKFDQMQKEQGKPTSDQLKIVDQLKAGWNAEGSPFQGQPFDPSLLNLGGM